MSTGGRGRRGTTPDADADADADAESVANTPFVNS